MKKDRNCNCGMQTPTPYPLPAGQMGYPVQMGSMMAGPMPMGQPGMYPINMEAMNVGITSNTTNNPNSGNEGISTNQAITAVEQLQSQINNLDRRVSRIESMLQDTKTNSFSSNKFTDSNYHIM